MARIVSYDRSVAADRVTVRLGRCVEGGLAPAILAIVDRGVLRRPHLVEGFRAEVELQMEGYPPVSVTFGEEVVVADGAARAPDLRLSGTLPDLSGLLVARLIGGVPNPIDRSGRSAIGMIAQRRVRFQGRVAVLRRFLTTIRI
jgi:hypothetical protein